MRIDCGMIGGIIGGALGGTFGTIREDKKTGKDRGGFLERTFKASMYGLVGGAAGFAAGTATDLLIKAISRGISYGSGRSSGPSFGGGGAVLLPDIGPIETRYDGIGGSGPSYYSASGHRLIGYKPTLPSFDTGAPSYNTDALGNALFDSKPISSDFKY